MKTILCTFICLMLLMNYSKAQGTFGIAAGATFASIKGKLDGLSLTSSTQTGFTAGITASVKMAKSFSFRPELNYTQKGGSLNLPQEAIKYNATFNYLELPMNFVYNTHSAKGKFFAGAGPSLAFALSGKYKITGMYNENGGLKFGSGSDADYKSFDIGINVLAGYQLSNRIFFTGNYNFGLSNTSADDSEKEYNRYFGIRIGYMFESIKK